jgi:hypothetical protein
VKLEAPLALARLTRLEERRDSQSVLKGQLADRVDLGILVGDPSGDRHPHQDEAENDRTYKEYALQVDPRIVGTETSHRQR